MENGQKEGLRVAFPELANHIFLLNEMIDSNEEIQNPYGGRIADYLNTARELDCILTKGIERIIRLSDTPQVLEPRGFLG
jgi:hypothetical protein